MDEKQSMFERGTLTEQEMSNMTAALKNPEFRKLLADYCDEMADPKNQALYEQELTQYEAERGIDLTFITPEPGFVIKTVVDGREKAFINVCRNGKVGRPTSRYATDAESRRGLEWSIPLTQAPPRQDYDNKKQKCTVYDVVFHPDTLHLAARSREFRQLTVSTACDAVESAFQVSLDRANVRFPKMTFKGTPRPTVIRKKINSNNKKHQPINRSSSSESEEASFTDQFYPTVDMSNLNGDRAPTVIKAATEQQHPHSEYTVPKYKLLHRRGVEMHEWTHEKDAKLNTTLPQELVITVDLPLLTTSQDVKLDVRDRHLELISEQPARYRLALDLPHSVLEEGGSAQFDSGRRQLTVTLPVNRRAELKLGDLTRALSKQASDSGLDSPSSHSHSSDEEIVAAAVAAEQSDEFLDHNTAYQLPTFTTNVLDNDVVLTLNVKNVDPASVVVRQEKAGDEGKSLQVKFYSVGSGYAPSHYAFYVRFAVPAIVQHSAEAWDNNVVLQVRLSAVPEVFEYGRTATEGLSSGQLWGGGRSAAGERKQKQKTEAEAEAFGVHVRDGGDARGMTIELSKGASEVEDEVFQAEEEEEEDKKAATKSTGKKEGREQKKAVAVGNKKGNKKNRKARSLSESDLKHHEQALAEANRVEEQRERELQASSSSVAAQKENLTRGTAGAGTAAMRKKRSVSESGGDIRDAQGNLFHFKGILKRRLFNRSTSESCSSVEEQGSLGVSFDMGVGSFGGIPEEDDDDDEEDSDHTMGSEKKHVTFNEVIRKQLFR